MHNALLVGLMSGTSMDGIDAALVDIRDQTVELIDCLEFPVSAELRQAIHEISHAGDNEIERLGQLDRQLGLCFGEVCLDLLRQAKVDRSQILAIGSHGQTIRHRPPSHICNGNTAYTLQIGDPNSIAEVTGITTVADFRRRDIAAGGEGAPLVPAFHRAVFARPGTSRAIVNIGGIANISYLSGEEVLGFDCGPGNTLLDQWIGHHQGQRYDVNGSWSAGGQVDQALLHRLLEHPFITRAPPKSTGKEVFNMPWLEERLREIPGLAARDVQATLCEYTATTIVGGLKSCGDADEVYVCGGGAANGDLMRRLHRRLAPVPLGTTSELGCDPAWVEAAAFAWLAYQRLNQLPGNISSVTGASGPRILGAIYPGD